MKTKKKPITKEETQALNKALTAGYGYSGKPKMIQLSEDQLCDILKIKGEEKRLFKKFIKKISKKTYVA